LDLVVSVINQGIMAAISVINTFPSERAVSSRERAAGMYRCSAYFMAKMVSQAHNTAHAKRTADFGFLGLYFMVKMISQSVPRADEAIIMQRVRSRTVPD
jgi:hypothetical protein